MTLTMTWPELLIAVILATAIYLLETVILSRRRRHGLHPAATGDLDNEVHKLRAEVITLQHRIEELEVRLGEESPEVEVSHSAYDYAIQYARQGMIAPEIAARCGISQDEATLIVALHRKGLSS